MTPSPARAAPHVPGSPPLPRLGRDVSVLGWALGHGVSALGDQVLYIALVFIATQMAPPSIAGLIIACTVAPSAILSLLAGAITDRTDSRRMMIVSDLTQLIVLLGALAVLALYGSSVWLLVALALTYGTASAFYDPASFSLPRQLRPAADLTRVASIRQLADRFGTVAGPPLGGLLVATLGLAGALAFDAATFAVIAILLLLVVRPRWPRARSTGGTVLADLGGGLSYCWRTPRVRNMVIVLAGMNVFTAPVVSVGLALRANQEGWGATPLGLLMAGLGGAAIAGTLVMVWVRPARPVFAALVMIMMTAPASLVLVGQAPYPIVMGATIAIGLVAGAASPLLAGAFQATLDESYTARAGSLLSVIHSSLVPLAIVGFGAVAGATSVATACGICGVAFAVQLAYSASRRRVRAMRIDQPADSDVEEAVP